MDIKNREVFDRLTAEALQQEFSGWEFSYLDNRWKDEPTSWDYLQLVRNHITAETRLLDMDTGGGEVLSSLQPLPKNTYATEGYIPNITTARNRLEPLGVKVIQVFDENSLPLETGTFDLVINRHGSFSAKELQRIMKPGGVFITQQVGGKNNFEINELLQEHPEFQYSYWTLDLACNQLEETGFQILDQKEEFPETTVLDIGALVFYLKVIPWQIADFNLEKYHDKLGEIHNVIQEEGCIKIKSHRFLVVAKKPQP